MLIHIKKDLYLNINSIDAINILNGQRYVVTTHDEMVDITDKDFEHILHQIRNNYIA